jgi:transposase
MTDASNPPPSRPRTRGRRFSLSEKIAIVRESRMPGMSAAHVARMHGVALNVLYYWRKAYGELALTDLTAVESRGTVAKEIEDLQLQVRNLERLLGKRTLEVALLRERLGKGDDDAEG